MTGSRKRSQQMAQVNSSLRLCSWLLWAISVEKQSMFLDQPDSKHNPAFDSILCYHRTPLLEPTSQFSKKACTTPVLETDWQVQKTTSYPLKNWTRLNDLNNNSCQMNKHSSVNTFYLAVPLIPLNSCIFLRSVVPSKQKLLLLFVYVPCGMQWWGLGGYVRMHKFWHCQG